MTPMKDLEYYMALPHTILLIPASEEDGGGWYARIPEWRGCMADGETQLEALQALEVVKRLWLEVNLEQGALIPKPAYATVT